MGIQTRSGTSPVFIQIKNANREVSDVDGERFEGFAEEATEEYLQGPCYERKMVREFTKEVAPTVQTDINFHVSYTSAVSGQEQWNKPSEVEEQANTEEVCRSFKGTPTLTPFDALRQKAYRFFGKLSGFQEGIEDMGFNADNGKNQKQLAKIGDYLVLSMPIDDEISGEVRYCG
ncbi:unnamed protein product [Agarophyton chilense]